MGRKPKKELTPEETEKKAKKHVKPRPDLLILPPQPDDHQAMLLFEKMGKDQREAADKLKRHQVRWLVDNYYICQKNRIMSAAQVRQAQEANEPNDLLHWFAETHRYSEDSLQKALDRFARRWKVGNWLQSLVGIGPVISAGVLCGFDIRVARHASRFIAYAGLDPTRKWEKGKKRPWNARLKTLIVFKAGESFVKTQNHEDGFYGKLFRIKRDELEEQNQKGMFAETAAEILRTRNFKKSRPMDEEDIEMSSEEEEKEWKSAAEWYTEGKLPPAHLHARARRFTAKIFLSHVHHVMFEDFHGYAPDLPYVFSKPEFASVHKHLILPPNWNEETKKSLPGLPLKGLFDGAPLPKTFQGTALDDLVG